MVIHLTDEQRRALRSGPVPVVVEHGETCEVCYLIDGKSLGKLRGREEVEAIRQALDDAESGRVLTLDQLDARIDAVLDRTNLA